MMKAFVLPIVIVAWVASAAKIERFEDSPLLQSGEHVTRNVAQMAYMSYVCMNNPNRGYISYGCYCGKGGGGSPVDKVDQCCKIHDKCYGDATGQGCTWPWSPHTITYYYDCDSTKLTINCKGKPGTCSRMACECDKAIAFCLYNTMHIYDPKYIKYDQNKCRK